MSSSPSMAGLTQVLVPLLGLYQYGAPVLSSMYLRDHSVSQ